MTLDESADELVKLILRVYKNKKGELTNERTED